MTILYGRKVQVSVAGLTISEPKIVFEIKKDTSEKPAAGHIAIWNLTPQHEAQIYETKGTITLAAGYERYPPIIFRGTPQKIEHERSGLKRETRIEVAALNSANEIKGGFTNRNYAKPTPLKSIVKDIVEQDFPPTQDGEPLILGPLDVIPDEILEAWTKSSPARVALTGLLGKRGVTWYDDDGIIRFSEKNKTQPGAKIVVVSPRTGLIGAPSVLQSAEPQKDDSTAALTGEDLARLRSVRTISKTIPRSRSIRSK